MNRSDMNMFNDLESVQNKILIPVAFHKLVRFRNHAGIILGNDAKKFAIYVNPLAGQLIQSLPAEEKRPSTHTLINYLLNGLDAKVVQLIINNYENKVFFSRLFVEQIKDGILHTTDTDARPSDGIILSLIYDVPIYCVSDVFEKTIPYED